jgi:hypothetical protein
MLGNRFPRVHQSKNNLKKDQFANFIADKCSSHNDSYKQIKLNINKILYVHTSSGYKYY